MRKDRYFTFARSLIMLACMFYASLPSFAAASDEIFELAKEIYLAGQSQDESSLYQSDEVKLDDFLELNETEELATFLNSSNQISKDLHEIYLISIDAFSDDKAVQQSGTKKLKSCADNKPPKLAHKCSISLSLQALYAAKNEDLLFWALKSAENTAKIPRNDQDFWYQRHLSGEMLFIAFILQQNISETISAGKLYLEASVNANVKVGEYYALQNLSYLARNEIDPVTALRIANLAKNDLDELTEEDQVPVLYMLAVGELEVGNLLDSLSYFDRLSLISTRPDLERAIATYVAFIYSKEKDVLLAENKLLLAKEKNQNDPQNKFGVYVLKTEKEIALRKDQFEKAILIDEKMDALLERMNKEAVSANRNRLATSLQITKERDQRERDKLKFEAQLNSERAESRQRQLMLSFAALLFLLGLAWYIYRSYRREQALNNEIQGKNDALEDVNADLEHANRDLNSAHNTLSATFKELKVAHKQALAGKDAKEKFIGVVGHELRTPLNPIINLASILEEQVSNSRQKALLKTIKNAGKRLHIIVENMLAISSAGEINNIYVEPIDVTYNTTLIVKDFTQEILSRNSTLKQSGESLKVNIYKDPELEEFYQSNTVIYRAIVRNLFDNAMKFTKSGKIVLELGRLKNQAGFKFSIHDTGVGIEQGKIKELIEPFEQAEMDLSRSYEGAGLGLAVVYKYCEQLGAKVSIESKVNVGTKVSIEFPEPAYEEETGALLKVA